MTEIIIIISLLILLPVTYWISKRITAKKTKRVILSQLNRGTGRMGIIKYSSGGNNAYLEVEELIVAGLRTKIIVHDVVIDRDNIEQDKHKILVKWGYSDWILTENIT